MQHSPKTEWPHETRCQAKRVRLNDCVDALSGAHEALTRHSGTMRSFVPSGNIYDLAERNLRKRGRPRTSLQPSRQPLQEQDAQLAARIGVPLYDPQKMRF